MPDCILRIKDQVNVKFEGLDPGVRRQICDATKYDIPNARHMPLFKLGRWDGKKHFATVGGATYVNMLDRALPIVYEAGYDIELIDERPPFDISFPDVHENILAHKTWPEGHPLEGEAIVLRDYQVEAIQRYFQNHQSIQELSTGCGKTVITAAISYLCEGLGRTIIIVPSKSLVEQTEEDFVNLGLDVGVFYGDRKEFGHKHTISTWQSLGLLGKKTRSGETLITIQEFLEDVIAFQVDEAHTATADVLRDLLCGPMAHIPLRWGMTGTIPPEDYNFATVLCAIGPVVGYVRAKELQDRGVLAKFDVNILQLDDGRASYSSYDDEHHFLVTNKQRLSWLAKKTIEISETGNTLVLVNNVATGKLLQEMIPDSVFIYGSVKTKNRKKEYKDVQTADGKVIIATYGVAAVGINVPRIFNLIVFEAGKSLVRVIQSIGRAIRVAADKDYANIYDVCSNLKFSKRHLLARKKFYDQREYPHNTTKINYLS